MKYNPYRLGEYRIIEYENGLLWWEKHHDFGVHRSGECFICGKILIIGDGRQEENGCLIGEFLDQLNQLPVWGKTPYYCFASEIIDLKTNRKLSEDLLKRISASGPLSRKDRPFSQGSKSESFYLGRFRISRALDGTISWQTIKDLNRVIGGRCFIESGILFLGFEEKEETEENRQAFLTGLKHYPPWKSTMAWCRPGVLRPVLHPEQTKKQAKSPPIFQEKDSGQRDQPSGTGKKERKMESLGRSTSTESPIKISPHTSNWFDARLKKGIPWRHGSWRWKFWIVGLLLLILSGAIVGLVLVYHERVGRFHWPHWFKEHQEDHHPRKHHAGPHSPVLPILLIFFLGVPLFLKGTVRAEERDMVLEESGIHYPRGFDPNTVGEIRGMAFTFSKPERGPVRFQLSSDRGTYIVLTAPHWYWHKIQAKIAEGTSVIVVGSKSYGLDGHLYIIAQEVQIVSSGRSFLFRGKDGIPLWKGSGESEHRKEKRGTSFIGGRKAVEISSSHAGR